MSALTGTQWIIQKYLEKGGASMDEESYQEFKAAMLGTWIYRYYDTFDCCLECGEHARSPEIATEHQRIHHPEWFVRDDEEERTNVRRSKMRRKAKTANANETI